MNPVLFAVLALACGMDAALAAPAADLVYRNGRVHTMDQGSTVHAAVAVRAGRIVYVGDDAGAAALAGQGTRTVDLDGRMLIPGLIDAHMHPQSGGSRQLACSLEYAPLTVPQFQARIQDCLDRDKSPPGRPLLVVNWFQQGMRPEGVVTTSATLDALQTSRPVIVRSSFGHSVLLNSNALGLAGIRHDTADPPAGKIVRDAGGKATGLLEDAAQDLAMRLLPPLTPAENLAAARAALDAMRRQGITGFLDAWTDLETLTAFEALRRRGELTARAHFAVLIEPAQARAPRDAVRALLMLQKRFDGGPARAAPSMQVRHAKLFMDGVIAAPALTGAMLAPYLVDRGSPGRPDWQPGPSRGPASYFSQPALVATLSALARARIDPHIHADGDRAVRESLDAIEKLRARPEGRAMRPALAHAEIVDPLDYPRFAQLGVTPVLSFQWAKPAPDTVDALREPLGPARHALVEPQALLLNAGARLAYGSDWPVDPLAPFFAFQVAVTRSAGPDALPAYRGRLGQQPGMPRAAVLRAATLDAAHALRQEASVGSLEPGKLADLVVLDGDFFAAPDEAIAGIRVVQTVVGGKIVYEAPGF